MVQAVSPIDSDSRLIIWHSVAIVGMVVKPICGTGLNTLKGNVPDVEAANRAGKRELASSPSSAVESLRLPAATIKRGGAGEIHEPCPANSSFDPLLSSHSRPLTAKKKAMAIRPPSDLSMDYSDPWKAFGDWHHLAIVRS